MSGLVTPTMTETVSGEFMDLAVPNMAQIHLHDIGWALSRQARYAGHTMSKIPYTVAQHTVMVSRYVEDALTPGTELNDVFKAYIEGKVKAAALAHHQGDDGEFAKWDDFQQHLNWVMSEAVGHRRMYALHGLLHDFAEGYLVDLPTPVKRLPGVYEAYKKYELLWDATIYERFDLGYGPQSTGEFKQRDGSMGNIKHYINWEFGLMVVGWADMYALLLEAYHFMPSRAKNWNIPLEGPTLSAIYNFRWPVPNEQAYLELLERYEEIKTPETIYD